MRFGCRCTGSREESALQLSPCAIEALTRPVRESDDTVRRDDAGHLGEGRVRALVIEDIAERVEGAVERAGSEWQLLAASTNPTNG